VKAGSKAVLERALGGWEEEAEQLRMTGRALSDAGYESPVPILAGTPNVFLRTAHGRERLVRDRRGWVGRESGLRMEEETPARMLSEDPGLVSPNVLLRPVVESAVLPVLAYVAGPGEIAYWAQLGRLFAHHGIPMPPVHRRASFLLMEERVRLDLEELGVPRESLIRPTHELLEERARATLDPGIEDALRKLRATLVDRFDAVGREVGSLDPTLSGAVGATRNRALREVVRLERKILRAQKRAESEWSTRLDGVVAHLRPLGHPQERVHNGIPYLVRHGEALLHGLLARIPEPVEDTGLAVEEVQRSAPAG
jgi:bacillithiol synthase